MDGSSEERGTDGHERMGLIIYLTFLAGARYATHARSARASKLDQNSHSEECGRPGNINGRGLSMSDTVLQLAAARTRHSAQGGRIHSSEWIDH